MCSRKWLIVAFVACVLASACSNYNTNLSIQTSSSLLTFVSPSTATVGSQGFTITANGSGFTTGALILWNGTALTTTQVSSLQLTAPVPPANLATAGTVSISVQIPGSAQSATQNVNNTTTTAVSNVVLFTINPTPAPPPTLTSLLASTTLAASTPYCSAQGFTLTVDGTNFTSDAVVNWNGAAQPTTFVSATQLTAAIPATNTALAGTAQVAVKNSVGASNSLPLAITSAGIVLPTPSITSVSPNATPAGSPPLTITAQGSFLPCSTLQWTNASNVTTQLPTTYVVPTGGGAAFLAAVVPALDLTGATTTQTIQVAALNPGAAASAALPFMVVPPTVASLSAATTQTNSTPACSASAVTITVTGTNFLNSSVVQWALNPPPALPSSLATTFVSSTQLTAVVPFSDIVSAATVNVQVSNSGVISNTSPFSVSASTPAAPVIASILPASATAGSAAATLIITGTNLLPCSAVQWTNGGTTQLATTYIAPTSTTAAQLSAIVPSSDIASVGTAQVAVATPASSANTSNSVSFPIALSTVSTLAPSTTPFCSPTGFTLTVNGTGFASGLVVNWNGSPRPTTFISSTQLSAAITPSDTAFLATGPASVAISVSGNGAGTNSNSQKFSVAALATGSTLPLPIITSSSLLPSNAAMEALSGPPIPLTVSGNSLSPCSVVNWSGAALPTAIFIGTNGLATFIPAANLNAVGNFPVSVTTPAPGGGTSGTASFNVFMPGSPNPGTIAGGAVSLPLMSADQRYAVFVLASTDGVNEVAGSTQNVFVTDTCTGASGCTPATTLVSTGFGAVPANGDSIAPSISTGATVSGRYVAFLSSATNLISGGTTNVLSAYVRDTCAGVAMGCTISTQLVSVSTGGTQANAPTTSATIDATGRYVTFESTASNLGASSSSGGIFVRDTCNGITSGCVQSTQALQ